MPALNYINHSQMINTYIVICTTIANRLIPSIVYSRATHYLYSFYSHCNVHACEVHIIDV